MPKTTMNPPGMMTPVGSYSQVAVAAPGRFVFIAGQGPSGEDGTVVGVNDIRAQTRKVLEKLERAAQAAGGSARDIVAMTVFITDARFYRDVNEVRREVLGSDFPTSTMVHVSSLARPEMMIEINAIAVVPEPAS